MNKIKLTDNFSLHEFQSPDTKEVIAHPKLVELLQALREELDTPLLINSAYRTPQHNEKVGSNPTSQHRKGTGADISTRDDRYITKGLKPIGMSAKGLQPVVEKLAEKIGIGRHNLGIGLANTFIHIDVRGLNGDPAPARWTY